MQEAIKHIGQSKESFLTTIRDKMRTANYSDNNISVHTIEMKEYEINSSDVRIANITGITSEKQHIFKD